MLLGCGACELRHLETQLSRAEMAPTRRQPVQHVILNKLRHLIDEEEEYRSPRHRGEVGYEAMAHLLA